MAYKYDKTSGTIKTSEAVNAYSGKGLAKAAKSSTKQHIPPYKAASAKTSVYAGTKHSVAHYQALYNPSTNHAPIHLVGGVRDLIVYRGLLAAAMLGIGVSMYSLFLMATNRMPRKER